MVENANKDDRSEQGNGKAQDCEQEKDIETPPIDAQAIEFECGLCNFKSKTKNVLEGHIRFDHLKCQTCKENFFTIEKFKSHMEKSQTVFGTRKRTVSFVRDHFQIGHCTRLI